ncbi:B mating type pheromone receptor [Pleurotus ostreatus PC15]|uniref:B mating type pheromone receptor n=1 Tax=Pleurotus ostreatus (strain PC15) TaxID=1137138 RepID=A0A067N9J3_PLEO1|nr:B mating type pheromone receptor [Pleurotus ostreatus PC15]
MQSQLPVAAFIAAFLVLIPFPWHWRARNIATCAMMIWLFIVNFIYGVNSLIFANTFRVKAVIWCDIATKIIVGASYALPLCTMCICKYLEAVSSNRKAAFDHSDKRRRIIFESIMCFGVPMVFMALHYIVQGHRFDIFEGFGCQATVFISLPAVLLIWFPQLLFSVLTLIYAALALHHFIRRRITFAAHLQNSNSALTPNRYLRLIAMSITEMLYGSALTSLNLYNNTLNGLRTYKSWEDVHFGFGRIDTYAKILYPQKFYKLMLLFWWTMPITAVIFFVFFGFGEEAKKEYGKLWAWTRRNVLRRKDSEKAKMIPLSGSNHQKFPKPLRLSTLGSTPRPMYSLNAPNANPSTRSCPSTFPRSIGSTESLPACIQISPASSPSHSPSSSYENLTITTSDSHYATAPSSGSFLTTKPSTTFTLRSIPSVERIYLVSSPSGSRPQRVRSLTPAPFSDLQEIPSEPEDDERSFYSQSQSQSQSTVSSRRPSLTEDGHDDETVQCEDRPHVDVVGALGHSNTPSYSQRGLMDAIRVTVHTETRHGA